MCGFYHFTVELMFLLSLSMGQRSGDVYILITDSIAEKIWQMDVTNSNYTSIGIDSHDNPIAIDYDPVQNKIYWTDIKLKNIRRCGFNGEELSLVYQMNKDAVADGMALDHISRLIFYTDTGNDVIALLDMTDFNHKTIISENLDQPRGIALDKANGMMFWTDWGTQPKIEKATYLGGNRTTLVSTGLIWPNGITLDTQAQKIYWCDAKLNSIQTVDFDGNNRTEFVRYDTFHPFDLVLFEEVLYTTEWHSRGLYLIFLDGRNTSKWSGMRFFRLNGLSVFRAGSFQNNTNACTNNKGGCEQICVPTSGGRQCACSAGMFLELNGLSCADGVKCNGSDGVSCNVHFDNSHIIYENGSVQFDSGGMCSTNGECLYCNKGFYPTAGYCDMCNSIDNCDLEECSSGSDETCSRCEGVVKDTAGLRAYVATSDRRQCRQVCSWRPDSTRCFPGSCDDELAAHCYCHTGFTGHHCQTIVTKPAMQVLVEITDSDEKQFVIDSRNTKTSQSSFWTNVKNPFSVHYKLSAQYTIPSSNTLSARPAYITRFEVGVIHGTFNFKLTRGTHVVANIHMPCNDTDAIHPKADLNNCDEVITPSVFPSPAVSFRNKDKIQLLFETSNGGYVSVKNEETGDMEKHFYDGQTERKSFTLNIDLNKPYHCSIKTTCSYNMVDVNDIIKRNDDSRVYIKPQGWIDDESGATDLNIKIIQLRFLSGQLLSRSGNLVYETTANISQDKMVMFTLRTLGVYSILLSSSDKAQNERKARRIVMYDPYSAITINNDQVIRITSAIASTNYTWQWNTKSIRMDFTGRYTNMLQATNNWLAAVADDTDIESQYDDYEGQRTVLEIPNKQGIVRFKTAYLINPKTQQLMSQPEDGLFQDQGLNTVVELSHQLVDGDVVYVWIKAYDVKDSVVAERTQVQVDSSPPEISGVIVEENSNNETIIHVRATDRHSGINKISWKITDTATNISFAFQEKLISPLVVTSCSHLTTLSEAEVCYCTPSSVCYSTDYTLKLMPIQDVKDTYIIVVTVWNNAQHPATTKTQGPAGDIKRGEGDIVTGETSSFTWGSVFERLQGIQFYKYAFGPRCYNLNEMVSDSSHIMVSNTTESAVTWIAPAAGNYYLTVVALNSTAHPIHSKCSDVISVVSPKIYRNKSEDTIINPLSRIDTTTPRTPDASREQVVTLFTYIPIAACVGAVLLVVVVIVVVIRVKRSRKRTDSGYDHLYINQTGQAPAERDVVFNIAYGLDSNINDSSTQHTACKEKGEEHSAQRVGDLQTAENLYFDIYPKEDQSQSDYIHPSSFVNEN